MRGNVAMRVLEPQLDFDAEGVHGSGEVDGNGKRVLDGFFGQKTRTAGQVIVVQTQVFRAAPRIIPDVVPISAPALHSVSRLAFDRLVILVIDPFQFRVIVWREAVFHPGAIHPCVAVCVEITNCTRPTSACPSPGNWYLQYDRRTLEGF